MYFFFLGGGGITCIHTMACSLLFSFLHPSPSPFLSPSGVSILLASSLSTVLPPFLSSYRLFLFSFSLPLPFPSSPCFHFFHPFFSPLLSPLSLLSLSPLSLLTSLSPFSLLTPSCLYSSFCKYVLLRDRCWSSILGCRFSSGQRQAPTVRRCVLRVSC